jgi:hypothetical protein
MPACTIDFIAVVYDFPFFLMNCAQNLDSPKYYFRGL